MPRKGITATPGEYGAVAKWDGKLETLERLAAEYRGGPISIRKWLYSIFGKEDKKVWTAPPEMTNGNMKYGNVVRIAADWDMEGVTTPAEFVQALRYDVVGTREHSRMSQYLYSLGRSSPEELTW